MKKLLALICFLIFSACVSRSLEAPPATHLTPPPSPKSLKEMISETLSSLYSYYLSDSSVPIVAIWQNINFKSWDYNKFFSSFCPPDAQKITETELICDYSLNREYKKFTIRKGAKIIIEIEKLGRETEENHFIVRGIWEIEGKEDDFVILRYEHIIVDYYEVYKYVRTQYFVSGGQRKIFAQGRIGNSLDGVYEFQTENLQFNLCDNLPNGSIYIKNEYQKSEAIFVENPACDKKCIYVRIDGRYGIFKYCHEWTLRDLFDYLNF